MIQKSFKKKRERNILTIIENKLVVTTVDKVELWVNRYILLYTDKQHRFTIMAQGTIFNI